MPKGAKEPGGPRALKLPDTPYNYAHIELPPQFRAEAARRRDNTPRGNPITNDGATLGRVLFYDTRLSANGTIACASCHDQRHAFSDPRGKFSTGYQGKLTDRHAMPLVEARFYARGRFFWDERARTLEEQVLIPIQNKVEMGNMLPKLMEALAATKEYPELYRKAFGDPAVTPDRTAKALAQFVRSLVSYQSKYDEGIAKVRSRDDDFPNFTREENHGKKLFNTHCAICHQPGEQSAVFASNNPMNNGLVVEMGPDLGVADTTFDTGQAGHFKSPSLRNVQHTAPYMHDGRFATLEEVIEHYSTGLSESRSLDSKFRDPRQTGPRPAGPFRGFAFGTEDKADLLAFLKTLTDETSLTDAKFSDPFEGRLPTPAAATLDAPEKSSGKSFTAERLAERLLAFDRGKTGKVTKEDLPERMHGLILLGDRNGDGALDAAEVKRLAERQRGPGGPPPGGPPRGPGGPRP
jgi:cytochrome c peroxidase